MSPMLRRISLLLIFALIFSVLAAPALGGWYLSRHHDRYAKRMAIPGVLELGPTDISRGWFRSESLISLVPVERFCGAPPCDPIRLISTIHHGPLPFTAPGTVSGFLKLARGIVTTQVEYATLFSALDFSEALPPLEVVSHIGLDGEVSTEVRMAAMLQEIEGGPLAGRLRTDRLQGELHVPGDRSGVTAEISFPRVKWVGEKGGQFDLIDLALAGSGEGRQGTLVDQQKLTLGSMQLATADGAAIAMQGMELDFERLPAEPGLASGDISLLISQMESRGEQYGPAVVDGRVSNFHLSTLNALQSEWRALEENGNNAGDDLSAATEALASMAMQRVHFAELLRHAPELRISRLLLATGMGDVNGKLSLRVSPDPLPDSVATPVNMEDLVDALIGTGELRVPMPLVRQVTGFLLARRSTVGSLAPSRDDVNDRLQRWQETGLLKPLPSDNAYLLELALEEGTLFVNDQPRNQWQDVAEEFNGG